MANLKDCDKDKNNDRRLIPTPKSRRVGALGAVLGELAKIALEPDGSARLAAHADALISGLTTIQLICTSCAVEPRKEGRAE
jgi:hypothetical protein